MSSLTDRLPRPTSIHRTRARVVAGVAAVAVSGAVLAAAASPAQAMPRGCDNIMSSMMFFEASMEMDVGPYAQYYTRDAALFNDEIRLYNSARC